MAKKRRHAAATSAQRATRETPVNHEAIEKSLETLGTHYDQLSADVTELPKSLERTLLLHSLVALVVQNAFITLAVESVSTAQIALVAGTAVWMSRKSFVRMFLPHIALLADSSREVFWRSVILVLALGALITALYRVGVQLNQIQLALFAVVFLLDVVSICLVRGAKGQLTRRQIGLSAVEVAFLVTGFSTCLHHKRELIYDELAFALTAATAFVHVVVLLTAKYVVLRCFASDPNGEFVKTKQRGAKLMESIWQDIDRFEPEQLHVGLTGASKKKKAKSKSRATSSKTSDAVNENSLVPQSRPSVFKEPRVQLALLTLIQMLLLISQLLLSAFILYAWEMISGLMLSSSHVLWTLGQVRRKVLSRSTIDPNARKYKSE